MSDQALLTMHGIHKRFGGVQALAGVDFSVRAGEVHALMGENGAGKSTLIRVLTGVHRPDAGAITFEGRLLHAASPADALAAGISTIHQEVNLIPSMSIAENLLIGRMPRRALALDWSRARDTARQLLRGIGLEVDVDRRLGDCSMAVQQMTAVARAISVQARLIVMDEPTSSLDRPEALRLLELIRDLKRRGVGVVFISHSLEEVYAVSDRMTVLRNGGRVGVFETASLPRLELVAHMLGRTKAADGARPAPGATARPSPYGKASADRRTQQHSAAGDDRSEPCPNLGSAASSHAPFLRVTDLGRRRAVTGVSFELRAGEVLGLAGLLGSGRSETARLIFGADRAESGAIEIHGQTLRRANPARAIRMGLGFCPEDRGAEGIVPELSVRENICLVIQRRLSRWGWLSRARQTRIAEDLVRRLDIAAAGPEQPVAQLSGGNQQKVVLARWLATQPALLILDEPTRGIDVGAKQAVESLVQELAAGGMSMLFISSELDEVLRASDRVLILHNRRPVGLLPRKQATAAVVLGLMAGHEAQGLQAGLEVAGEPALLASEALAVQTKARAHAAGFTAHAAPASEEAQARECETRGESDALKPALPADLRSARPAARRRTWGWPAWTLPLMALVILLALNMVLVPRFAQLQFRDGRWEGAIVQILRQAAPVMILSIGMTWVIALGGIDLSIGSIMAMSAAASAVALTQHGCGAAGAIVAGMGAALVAGTWNGVLVAGFRLPPIIATLILLVAGRGLAQLPTQGLVITFESPAFERLASGTILGMPLPIFLAAGTALLAMLMTRRTAVGMYLEATGGSRAAARLCGLPVRTLELLSYVASGLCAGLAGLIVTADTKAADVSICGLYLELDTILAVVIGGTRLSGGRVRLAGSLIGALLMQTLTTTLLMSNVPPAQALLVKGAAALGVCMIQSPTLQDRWRWTVLRVRGSPWKPVIPR